MLNAAARMTPLWLVFCIGATACCGEGEEGVADPSDDLGTADFGEVDDGADAPDAAFGDVDAGTGESDGSWEDADATADAGDDCFEEPGLPRGYDCAYTKLHLDGGRIVNEEGCEVVLRGLTLEGLLGGYGMGMWGETYHDEVEQVEVQLNRQHALAELWMRDRHGEEIGVVFDAWRDVIAGPEDFQRMHALGFNVVRLWTDYRIFGDNGDPPQYREAGFEAVARVLDHATGWSTPLEM